MNASVNSLFSDVYTQKMFFKNSILNSVIIYKLLIKDYFKYFLHNLSPLSRYEFWCFIFSLFGSSIILLSILFFINILTPHYKLYDYKLYLDILFYIYIFFALNVSVRAFACRIISVQNYINNNDNLTIQHNKTSYIESAIKKFFINTKTYFYIAYINIFIIFIFLVFHIFGDNKISHFIANNHILSNTIYFIVFIFQMSAVMYVVLLLLPSKSSLEYFMDKNIKYYAVFHYYSVFAKYKLVDYLTLIAGILSVIAIGYLFIIGFTLSCHFIVCLTLIIQSVALIFSGRYFSIIIGIINLIYITTFLISVSYYVTTDIFYNPDIIMQILNYYQVSIAMIFIGIFYYVIFDKDILKMVAVLGYYLSALFLWEDYEAIKNIVVYNNHTIPVLFYGVIGLLTCFAYLIRVANNKGYVSDVQIYNNYKDYVNQVTYKYIYMIIFYFCLLMILYSCCLLLMPVLNRFIDVNIFDSYNLNFIHNIRKMITLYIFLGIFLLFKDNKDIFSIFLISFIVVCELYIIIYPSLENIFPLYMIFDIKYLYSVSYVLICVLSINLFKYSKFMALGFSIALIMFIISLINIFIDIYPQNTLIFYIFFVSLLTSNILIAIGAYKNMKYYS